MLLERLSASWLRAKALIHRRKRLDPSRLFRLKALGDLRVQVLQPLRDLTTQVLCLGPRHSSPIV